MNTQALSPGRTSSLSLRDCASVAHRRRRLIATGHLPTSALADAEELPPEIARLTENVVGSYRYPVGVAEHFMVNRREVAVCMAAQEPTVVAAAASAAKRCRRSGGFRVQVGENLVTCQVGFVLPTPAHAERAAARLDKSRPRLLADLAKHDTMKARGGGVCGLEREVLGDMLDVRLTVSCAQAMGANAVTRLGERLAELLEKELEFRRLMAIVSNCFQGMRVTATALWYHRDLATPDMTGKLVATRICQAQKYAERSPLRAATHNKGALNGICAVARAAGQDVEAIVASIRCREESRPFGTPVGPLTFYRQSEIGLRGEIAMTLPLGIVGGATGHPDAVRSLKAMGVTDVRQLAEIVGAAALASNLAALRCLVTTGIPAANERVAR